jgi:hypothetical protein
VDQPVRHSLQPRRSLKQPLDALLASLTPTPARVPAGARAIGVLRRDLLRTEFAVQLMPWLGSTCLYRAIARYAVLRANGLDATFVMGVNARGLKEDGHAWVEVEGEPFVEPNDVTQYAVTFRYPPPQSSR